MFVGTSKEKFLYHNTLLCLVKALQGKNVTVDLRNDSYICGCISSVDGYMNITFTSAVFCDPQGNEYSFENMFIQSRNIRYVHVPEEVPNMVKENIVKKQVSILAAAMGLQPVSYGIPAKSGIFYVPNMSMLATIRYELGYDKVREPKKPAKKSRKAMKAFQQHMQTVASLDI